MRKESKLIKIVGIDDIIDKLGKDDKITYIVSFNAEELTDLFHCIKPNNIDSIPKFLIDFKADIVKCVFEPEHYNIKEVAQRIVDKYGSMELELKILRGDDPFWTEINPVNTSNIYQDDK